MSIAELHNKNVSTISFLQGKEAKVKALHITNIHKPFWLVVLIIAIGFSLSVQAQNKTIAIVKDNDSPFINQLESELKNEISDVLIARYSVDFKSYVGNNDNMLINQHFETIYKNNEVDLVIAIGISSSNLLHTLKTHPIPSIATMVMEEQTKDVSGVYNYTYEVPFKSTSEIASYFSKMYNLQTIGIPVDGLLSNDILNNLENENVRIEPFNVNVVKIPENVDGILLLPLAFHTEKEVEAFIKKANEQKIPTLSILKNYLIYDCTAAIDDKNIIVPLIKKTALNSLYILEGSDASEIKIQQTVQDINIILNMKGVKIIKKLPNWNYIESAELVNVTKNNEANPLSLSEAIVIGLQDKLSLKKSILAIDKAEENVKQAKGNLTPSLSADVQTKWLSDNLVEAFLGREGSTTITGSLNLQQVIFSEPVLTNVAINKLVQENTTEQNRQTILDDVVTIAQTYISVLLAKTNLTLQNENLNVTKANLSVAENKDKLGLSKQSDVNRWISELNMNKIQLSNALANYKKAVYTLNETLNQDISIEYNFPESIDIDEALNFPEELIIPFIKDEYLTEILADFYLKEMQSYSPELMRVLISEQIIDRQIKSNKRQYVLPDVVGFANASDVFLREGNYTDPNLPVPPLPNDLTWNAGIGLSLPIFDRRTRSTNLQKSIIDKEIIQYSKQEIENALERNIRTQVHQFKASYVSNDFALKASEAADKNFSQVEDAYKQGFITVTQLLEAQSSKFNANLLAVQTNYKVVLDYLILERLTGKIQLLDTETQQKEYLIRLQQHLITRE